MLTKLPLRSKLIMVVSIPLFVILGFATFGMAGRMSDLDAQRQYSRLRAPNDALTSVANTLESEGVLTTWFNAGHAPDVQARLARARHDTNQAVATLAGSGAALAEGNVAPGTLSSWKTLVGRLHATIGTTRNQVDGQTADAPTAGATYLDLGNDTLAVSELVARDLSNRDLSASMLGLVDLRREQLESAREAEIVLPFVVTGRSDQLTNWISAITAQRADVAKFRAAATPAARAAFEKVRATPPPDDLMRVADGSTLPTAFPKVQMSPDFYLSAWQAKESYLVHGVGAVQNVIDTKASGLESDALAGVLWYGLGVSGLVLLVLVLTWITIRSVNKSLRTLTEAARDVAENRLPHLVDTLGKGGELTAGELADLTPIKINSKDELGELATAFNTIQRVAVAVAEEQSALLRKGIGDLYVNLARRNQSLLDRQIALLDDMEARAEDSDYLGALFELDHLATRMRRNAESLLVMSGAEQPRQWHESIPMLDVVRAATAEITDFARVGYYGFEGEVAIAGNAVADVTHLLAELFENATVFSPPGTPVVVTGQRAERRYVISITDEGIGMTDERLTAANALLAKPPATGLALSRTLGLHVVGNLATRYGIAVQLRRAATGGITAVVALPAKVLARLPRPEDGSEHRPTRVDLEGPVAGEPVDLQPARERYPELEVVNETPVFEPVFEPGFEPGNESVFEPVIEGAFAEGRFEAAFEARGGQPSPRPEAPAAAAAPTAPTGPTTASPGSTPGGEALIFTPDAVFVGSPSDARAETPAEMPSAGPVDAPAPADPITWQPAFAASAETATAASPSGPAPAPAPQGPNGQAPSAPSGRGPADAAVPPPPQRVHPAGSGRPAPPPPVSAPPISTPPVSAPAAPAPTASAPAHEPVAQWSTEPPETGDFGDGRSEDDDFHRGPFRDEHFRDGQFRDGVFPDDGFQDDTFPTGSRVEPSWARPEATEADEPVTPLSRRVPGAAFSPAPDAPPRDATPHDPTVPGEPPAGAAPGLAHRTPGKHLSHKPAAPSAPSLDGEPRPRPERVHDLLARHLRGIREGRTGLAHADEPVWTEDEQ